MLQAISDCAYKYRNNIEKCFRGKITSNLILKACVQRENDLMCVCEQLGVENCENMKRKTN